MDTDNEDSNFIRKISSTQFPETVETTDVKNSIVTELHSDMSNNSNNYFLNENSKPDSSDEDMALQDTHLVEELINCNQLNVENSYSTGIKSFSQHTNMEFSENQTEEEKLNNFNNNSTSATTSKVELDPEKSKPYEDSGSLEKIPSQDPQDQQNNQEQLNVEHLKDETQVPQSSIYDKTPIEPAEPEESIKNSHNEQEPLQIAIDLENGNQDSFNQLSDTKFIFEESNSHEATSSENHPEHVTNENTQQDTVSMEHGWSYKDQTFKFNGNDNELVSSHSSVNKLGVGSITNSTETSPLSDDADNGVKNFINRNPKDKFTFSSSEEFPLQQDNLGCIGSKNNIILNVNSENHLNINDYNNKSFGDGLSGLNNNSENEVEQNNTDSSLKQIPTEDSTVPFNDNNIPTRKESSYEGFSKETPKNEAQEDQNILSTSSNLIPQNDIQGNDLSNTSPQLPEENKTCTDNKTCTENGNSKLSNDLPDSSDYETFDPEKPEIILSTHDLKSSYVSVTTYNSHPNMEKRKFASSGKPSSEKILSVENSDESSFKSTENSKFEATQNEESNRSDCNSENLLNTQINSTPKVSTLESVFQEDVNNKDSESIPTTSLIETDTITHETISRHEDSEGAHCEVLFSKTVFPHTTPEKLSGVQNERMRSTRNPPTLKELCLKTLNSLKFHPKGFEKSKPSEDKLQSSKKLSTGKQIFKRFTNDVFSKHGKNDTTPKENSENINTTNLRNKQANGQHSENEEGESSFEAKKARWLIFDMKSKLQRLQQEEERVKTISVLTFKKFTSKECPDDKKRLERIKQLRQEVWENDIEAKAFKEALFVFSDFVDTEELRQLREIKHESVEIKRRIEKLKKYIEVGEQCRGRVDDTCSQLRLVAEKIIEKAKDLEVNLDIIESTIVKDKKNKSK